MPGDTGLVGVLPWSAVLAVKDDSDLRVREVMIPPMALAHPEEILRTVVDRVDATHLDGLINQFDLLNARQKLLDEERHAERMLTLRRATSATTNGAETGVPVGEIEGE